MKDIRKIGVLKSYVNFQLLDYIFEKYEAKDEAAKNLISAFSKKKSFDEEITLSCISCKETTLSLLAGMIFFVRSSSLQPLEKDRYKWWDYLDFESDVPNRVDVRQHAIIIIRNAIAHWGEGETGIEFDEYSTKFSSNTGAIRLTDDGLHLLIMQLYGYAQA